MHWQRVLHHVTVEVMALAQAGRDVNAVYTERAVNVEDWKRTRRVEVKVKGNAVELQMPPKDSVEQILKAVPASLAEEIIMAAENAEALSEPVTEETLQELTQESAEEGVEAAAETLAEEDLEIAAQTATEDSAEGLAKPHVNPKDIDAAEKTTMRAIWLAIKVSSAQSYTIRHSIRKREEVMYPDDKDFLQVPLADPTIKLAVSLLRPHNTDIYADTLTDCQACAAIDRPAPTRSRDFICNHRSRPFISRQIQGRAQKAVGELTAEGGGECAQRNGPQIQANTDSQAHRGWQVEGDRGGADQQRPSRHW